MNWENQSEAECAAGMDAAMEAEKARLSPVPSKPLLGCPFCGATPEKMGNTTSVWVPHKRDCFLRPAALSELGQVRWNIRQPNNGLYMRVGQIACNEVDVFIKSEKLRSFNTMEKNKPFVIIESPFAGDVKRNKIYVRRCLKDSLYRGEVPFASHALYTQCLNDKITKERKLGMEAGFEVVGRSDFTAVYGDYGISGGMKEGIKLAKSLKHRLEYRRIGLNP